MPHEERGAPREAELDRGDREALAAIEAVGKQYEGYLSMQAPLSAVLAEEPETWATPGWDHPLGLVIYK